MAQIVFRLDKRGYGKESLAGLRAPSKLPHVAADNRVGEVTAERCQRLQDRRARRHDICPSEPEEVIIRTVVPCALFRREDQVFFAGS